MDYKSNKSKHFGELLERMSEEDKILVLDLEKYTRLLVHTYDLVGEIDPKIFASLARTSRKLQVLYEAVHDRQ